MSITHPTQPREHAPGTEEVSGAITAFTDILEKLQQSHRTLEERAQRVEAELCETNDELASKVEELDRVKQHLEAVLAAIPTGVVVYDPEGRVVRVNDSATQILGAARVELGDEDSVSAIAGSATDGAPVEVECADGEVRVLSRRRSAVQLSGASAGGTVEIIEDQSALVRAKERLHRLDKFAALGTMAGGIAHEIRNPLHAIQGFAQLLCREPAVAGHERATRHATRIREGVAEIEAIVASMLGISGEGTLALEQFEVKNLLEDAVAAARRGLQDTDRWQVTIDAPAVTVVADRMKLRQAVRNLVANACQAQPDGGRVQVQATAHQAQVRLVVSDDGPGVRAADVHRLSDPFFTTRAEGTGLGLALVQRVAELHDGSLDLEPPPAPLSGASFALSLPAAARGASPAAAPIL